MRFVFAFFVMFSLTFFALPALALESGPGSYEYHDAPSGKTITVWYYKPARATEKTPVVITLHGMGRNAQGSRNDWQRHADRLGIMVLAPHFDKILFSGSRTYTQGNVFKKDGTKNPQELWSLHLPDAIFTDFVTNREKSTATQYSLFGHSAGAQFAHRMLLLLPDTKANLILIANAGWYTMPDPDTAWPLGIKDMGLTDADRKRFVTFPLVLLLGEADNDPNHHQLDRSPEKDIQGDNRLARGKYYHVMGEALARKLHAPFGWTIRTVPNVAHSNGGMVNAAAAVVEEAIQKAAALSGQ